MTTDPGAAVPGRDPHHPPGRHGRLIAVVVALVVTVAVVVVVLVARGGSGGPSAQAPTSAATSTSSSLPTSTSPTSATSATSATNLPTQTAITPAPSAHDQLESFFDAARRMDEQLHTAAANINAAGPPWYVLDESVASSVRAADETKVRVTIPGGMPPELLRQVFVVYSELVGRHAAMTGFRTAHGYESEPPLPPGVESRSSTEALLSQLKHGAEAAMRFEGDLSAARSTAQATPPFDRAAFGSRADMEIWLLAEYVRKGNVGCGATGGTIVRTLPTIRWESASTGTIGGLPFVIRLEPSGRYSEDPIQVC